MGDDFYIGYHERAPVNLGSFLRRTVILLLAAGAGLAATLAVTQSHFDPGVFEYGVAREFEGMIHESPYPHLVTELPVPIGERTASRLSLVAFGKRGAAELVHGLDGHRVRLMGSLIYREGEAMIEVAGGSVASLGQEGPANARTAVDLGRHTLRGEIVDSKCFLGVMKPGRGKPHRACAVRCISGGVPPVLRVQDADGAFLHLLLVDELGEAVNDRILDFVAEPIEITGRLERRGDSLVLLASIGDYERL